MTMIEGVVSADLNFASGVLLVEYEAGSDPCAAIVTEVQRSGHGIVGIGGAAVAPGAAEPAQPSWYRANRATVAVVGSGAFAALGAVAGYLAGAGAGWTSPVYAVSVACYLLSVAAGMTLLLPRALVSVRARVLDMNALMIVAVVGAIALGDYSEASAVVFLFALGGWLEAKALQRTRGSIRALMDLTPPTARVVRAGAEEVVEAAEVAPGDVVVVRPGERFALDGTVRSGVSSADEAPITGESVPVEKRSGDTVYAGSLNTTGLLEVEVTAPAEDSTLARIVYMVEEAQAAKAPVQLLVDRFSRYYTPAVVAFALAVWIVPVVVTGAWGDADAWTLWLSRALVVLVTACPCALVISTPVTFVSAISRAGRDGVLVKGGAYLELVARTRAVAFDKTGTLTSGRLELRRAEALGGEDPAGIIAAAASLDAHSNHPLARAVVAAAEGRGLVLEPVTDFEELPGRGVSGTLRGRRLALVSPAFALETARVEAALADAVAGAEDEGMTALVLVDEGVARGFLGVSDRQRREAPSVVEALRAGGVEHVTLLTGDNERTAAAVAARAGVSAHMARLLPSDKVDAVLRLKERYGVVAMVGDGVNDAPALAAADIGIAMGAAGSDTALETADVALMSDDLAALPGFFALGRATLAIVKQNVAFSVLVKVLVLVLAVFGLANMWMAVFADTGVALLVIANGMRLLGHRGAGERGTTANAATE